jgi:predicted DNA-binding ArsR family transcriptional regulator
MSVKQRLIEFIKHLGISQRAFEKAVGLSNGYVNNISVSIGHDKMLSISLHYPQLNTDWLMTGQGEMLNDEYHQAQKKEEVLMEPHFDYQTIESLSKAINRLTEMYDRVVQENDELRNELENLRRVASAQKVGA